jgi:hypothetical protein
LTAGFCSGIKKTKCGVKKDGTRRKKEIFYSKQNLDSLGGKSDKKQKKGHLCCRGSSIVLSDYSG